MMEGRYIIISPTDFVFLNNTHVVWAQIAFFYNSTRLYTNFFSRHTKISPSNAPLKICTISKTSLKERLLLWGGSDWISDWLIDYFDLFSLTMLLMLFLRKCNVCHDRFSLHILCFFSLVSYGMKVYTWKTKIGQYCTPYIIFKSDLKSEPSHTHTD